MCRQRTNATIYLHYFKQELAIIVLPRRKLEDEVVGCVALYAGAVAAAYNFMIRLGVNSI